MDKNKRIENLVANGAHLHVLARGTPEQSLKLLSAVDDSLSNSLNLVSQAHKLEGNKNQKMVLSALKKDESDSAKSGAIRDIANKALQEGGSFGDDVLNVVRNVGETALKALPIVAPILLSAL